MYPHTNGMTAAESFELLATATSGIHVSIEELVCSYGCLPQLLCNSENEFSFEIEPLVTWHLIVYSYRREKEQTNRETDKKKKREKH